MNIEYRIVAPDELYHYGVKGMRWGVRHDTPSSGKRHSKSKLSIRGYYQARKKYSDRLKSIENTGAGAEYKKAFYGGGATDWANIEKLSKTIDSQKEAAKKQYYKDAKKAGVNIKLIKGIAVGGAVLGAVGLYAYGHHVVKTQAAILGKYATDRLAGKFSKMPLSKLSGKDEIITKGTNLQRIIRHPDKATAYAAEKGRDTIWVTRTKNDNAIYKTLLNARGKGSKFESTRKVVNDMRAPSERKRVMTFMQLVNNDPSFRKALEDDYANMMGGSKVFGLKIDTKHTRQYYDIFNQMAGSSKSKSAPMYFKKIKDMGYNAINDDNDAGYLGTAPTILLNASKDTTITGMRRVRLLRGMMSGIKMNANKI